ncbi:hypothetical protein UK23_39525 [Lentzea aerocolonigenes]|uniref:Uncharacterized protein n=1 Tax=Lentzea aerocolonigenes TaxID=68170 RepID=A0A0F0GJ56_LENAE|nr:hypothetical protein [Lentzea aerocolonigenes]KJK41962.1 hypothetical protein UK23_39525 [Lentzea aerocolonigenes]
MGEQGLSNLERRYRRLLRVLPKWYRRDREEEMVGLFLADRTDELDLEHGWPGWGETAAMFGLAVRTHLAAGAAFTNVPAKVVWRGEIVRALGMIGLLLGVFFAGAAITQLAVAYGNPAWAPEISWWRLLEIGPIVAFAALLGGRRTLAKVSALAPVLLAVASLGEYRYVLLWSAFQVPSLVTFVCLCLGFHREAPTPPARRLLWWGGGAVLLGVLGGFASGLGLIVVGLVTVAMRVVAFVRGDFVLGRALSLFAVLQLAPLAFLLVGGEALVLALPIVVLLVFSALAPVRKPRLS